MVSHRLCLDALNAVGSSAMDMVNFAAAAGFDYVGLLLNPIRVFPLPTCGEVTDLAARAALQKRMQETGVSLYNIEAFNLLEGESVEDFRPALECGRALGARCGTAIIMQNDDRSSALAMYRGVCDMAAEYDIRINVEFFASSTSMNRLDVAVDFVREADRTNAAVLVDILHLIRNGGTIADVRQLDPALIGYAQICDGPATMALEQHLVEAAGERLYPGEGMLPVSEFLQALPADIVVGVEAPKSSLAGIVTPGEQAQNMMRATKQVYAALA